MSGVGCRVSEIVDPGEVIGDARDHRIIVRLQRGIEKKQSRAR